MPGLHRFWRLVTRDLPDKVKFLFAQRPEDELISSNAFIALDNVIRLPNQPLGVLASGEVEDIIRLRADEVGQPVRTLQKALTMYQGHPYAIQAAMEIVKRRDPSRTYPRPDEDRRRPMAASLPDRRDAIRLFEAYAILEVAVPQDVIQGVSGLDSPAMKRLLNNTYLRGLLQDEGQGGGCITQSWPIMCESRSLRPAEGHSCPSNPPLSDES